MSQMFAEQVGVDFNVGGNFQASLTQMIAQADQYARSADTLIGKIAGLNVVNTALIKSTASLTQVNKVATAEAAAYQQQMSGLAATAAVTGKSYSQLASSTQALARETGSMGEAVRIMEALSTSGVTATKSVNEMAKAWHQLGAATGFDPTAIGSALLTLNRQFGQSEHAFRGFSDTVVSLSKNYGASAGAITSFAQQLGPVAAQAGVSEGAVLGLSAAAAKLGADGAAAGTAFTKVMLDLNHSIRDGTPEIRTYAAALGVSTDQLRQLYRNDPTEVLVRFTEAIRTGGPQSSRILEQLGLDSTRTVRALSALGQADLRKGIADAIGAFGGGATTTGAAAALDNVNHSAEQLRETLSQTVAAAGQPFLGFLNEVLKVSTNIAGAFRAIVASAPVQWIGSVSGILRLAGGLGTTAVTAVSLGAIARQVLIGGRVRPDRMGEEPGLFDPSGRAYRGGLAGMLENARMATMATRAGVRISPEAPLTMRLGAFVGEQFPEPIIPRGGGLGALSLAGAFRGGTNWLAQYANMTARVMAPLSGRDVPYSPEGQTARQQLAQVWGVGEGRAGAGFLGEQSQRSWKQLGDAVQRSGLAIGSWAKEVTKSEKPVANLANALGRVGAQTLAGGGQLLGGAIRGGGRLAEAIGFTPAGLAVTAGIGVATAAFATLKGMADEADAAWKNMGGGINDVYGAFNQFANAAGLATKGVVALGAASTKTAQQVFGAVPPGGTGRGPLTYEQVQFAQTAGYKPSFTAAKGATQDQATVQAAQVLAEAGPNASPEVFTNLQASLVHTYGPTQGAAMFQRAMSLAASPDRLTAAAINNITTEGLFGKPTEASQAISKGIGEVAGANVTKYTGAYGTAVTGQLEARNARSIYEQGLASSNEDGRRAAAKNVAQLLNMGPGGEEYVLAGLDAGQSFDDLASRARAGRAAGGTAPAAGPNVGPLTTAAMGGGGGPGARAAAAAGGVGFIPNPQAGVGGIPSTATGPGGIVAAPGGTALGQLGAAPGLAAMPLTGTMSSAEQSVREMDLTVSKASGKFSSLGDALYGAEQAARHNQGTVDDLSAAQVKALDATNQAILRLNQSITPANVQQAGGLLANTALQGTGGNAPMAILQLQQALGAAQSAGQAGTAAGIQQSIANIQAIDALRRRGASAFATQGAGIAAGVLAARTPAREAGTTEEIGRQQALAGGQELFGARIDFMKQFNQASEELNIAWVRQQEEAQIQVARSEEDFHKQRLRAQRDFNKQIQRMVEDQAKSIYDPYQRIQAQSVWDSQSLLANLAEQNTAIARQTQQLAQLRRMGLSQQAADLLKLADPAQAQQVSRLLEEASGSPQILRQLNLQTTQRLAVTRQATVNENNVAYRRSRQDFNVQMADSEKDFRQSLARMNADLQRSHEHALEDLARMGREANDSLTTVIAKFIQNVTDLPTKAKGPLAQTLKDMLQYAVNQAGGDLTILLHPYTGQSKIQVIYTHPTEHGGTPGSTEVGIQPPSGAGPNTFVPPAVTHPRQSLPNSVKDAFAFARAEDEHASKNWHGMCDNFVARSYGLAHSGYATAKAHWAGIPAGYKGGGTPPPGALVFWGNGNAGHTALSIGAGLVYSTDFVRDGQVDVTGVDDISRHWGGYQGWSVPYFQGKTAPIAMAEGGIALRHGRYELAERGRGEAVIPLDGRGAAVLAETMTRYADRAAEARTQPYATYVSHGGSYTYDQRVQVLGPVTVPAPDPDTFLRKMDEKARQARLVQPVGRG